MKGGYHGVRGKQISLILIALVCTTIVIWAWEGTPFQTNATNTHSVYKGDVWKDGTINGQEEVQSFDAAATTNPSKSTPVEEEKEDEVKHKFVPQGEARENGNIDLMPPVAFTNTSSVARKRACNFAKGEWINDNSRPLYSGSNCKQWLSRMWACRLTRRTDFEYEKLRWQPKDCVMENFRGSKFLERMRNKTLAFVGDSLSRQQFQSLMCMVTGGQKRPDVVNVGSDFGLVKPPGAVRPEGWAYRFPTTNTTILFYWSASLCDLEPLNLTKQAAIHYTMHPNQPPAIYYAMHLDQPPAFLQQFIHRFDVLVLNTGAHWNSWKLQTNRWVMHVGGVPITDSKLAANNVAGAKNLTIRSVVNW